ncbi:MAG: TIR domain-containing protein, partial [Pseudomonadota bacterium]
PLENLSALQMLYLHNTQVADIAPLENLSALQMLYLHNTQVDLFALTAPGAAWEAEDRDLRDLEFRNTPATAKGGPLAGLYEEELRDKPRTAKALALLREARDRRPPPPPPPPPAPDRPFVFLSYSRADAEKAAALRAALEADRVPIWQDVEMRAGARFREEIANRLDAAAAVLVLWSETSVGSDYVTSEAERARAAGKIVPARIEECDVPSPFDVFNTAELSAIEFYDPRKTTLASDAPVERYAFDPTDRSYRTLLASLREYLTPGAEVGAELTEQGKIAPLQLPEDVSPPKPDKDELVTALAAQLFLIGMFEEEIADEPQMDRRVERRLARYKLCLSDTAPLWQNIDNAFGVLTPLIRDEEIDDGLIEAARRMREGHRDLGQRMNPAETQPLRPSEARPVDPETAKDAVPILRRAAEAMAEASGAFDPSAAAFMAGLADDVEAFASEPLTVGEDIQAAERERDAKSGGRIWTAAGFLGAVGSLASIASLTIAPGVLTTISESWVALIRLMFG